MQQFQKINSQFSLKWKLVLLISLVLVQGAIFLISGDSTELRDLAQLVLQLGQIIVDETIPHGIASDTSDNASL